MKNKDNMNISILALSFIVFHMINLTELKYIYVIKYIRNYMNNNLIICIGFD